MPSKIQTFEAGSLVKGVNVHTPDFAQDIELTLATLNMSSGVSLGVGPRFCMAPVPGHASSGGLASNQLPGLLGAETNLGLDSNIQRLKIYALWPISLGGVNANLKTRQKYYAAVIAYVVVNSGAVLCDVVLLSTYRTGAQANIAEQSPNIYDGLSFASWTVQNKVFNISPDNDLVYNNLAIFEMMQNGAVDALTSLAAPLTDPANFVCSTPFSVTNPSIPNNWLVGNTNYGTANGVATAPSLQLTKAVSLGTTGFFQVMLTGIPSEFVYGNFSSVQRNANIFALDINGNQNIDYAVNFTPSTSVFAPTYDMQEYAAPNINVGAITATKSTAGTTYSATKMAVYNDTEVKINASYQGVLVAAKTAMCFIMQDWIRSFSGTMTQYVDLVNLPLKPYANVSRYVEDTTATPSPFRDFPAFVRGMAMATNSLGTGLGAASSGILRANTTYEFSYSLFNKRLNIESNVGTPVKIQTGTTDFVSLILFANTATGSNKTQMAQYLNVGTSVLPLPIYASNATSLAGQHQFAMNHLEYRFYYRQEGQQEWLPALFIDAVKWWLYPYNIKLSACAGAIGGLPGGRPGGYRDYSNLPADVYTCVVMYKGRAFWMSDKALCFSLQNNIFAYPTSNIAACPVGSFKGAIVQAYYGQAEQDARLVIFSTNGTYVGKFTGVPDQIPVQVSATSIANFALDGSDFVINTWTSMSAFSYRSAIVAEGILYFWGPDGVFMDNGVDALQRISIPIEPDIFNLYDPSQTDNIHCSYNNTTKEIFWYYKPKVADSNATHTLCWNKVREQWLPGGFAGQIDATQQLAIDTPIGTAGTRLLAFARPVPGDSGVSSTVQRAYFYDHNNRGGDIFPGRELMVASFTTPAAGKRRFTLAGGYVTAQLAKIAVGDLICAQQMNAYAGNQLTSPQDFIGTVSTINSAGGTIDVVLPTGLTLDGTPLSTLTPAQYFPLYHAKPADVGLNGVKYVWDTDYWTPGGMTFWAHWLHLHLQFKTAVILPSTVPLAVNIGYRSPIADAGSITDVLSLISNSDLNCQILHLMQIGDQVIEGQAIRINLSGIQLGAQWMLQYLAAYTRPIDGHQLSYFEG